MCHNTTVNWWDDPADFLTGLAYQINEFQRSLIGVQDRRANSMGKQALWKVHELGTLMLDQIE